LLQNLKEEYKVLLFPKFGVMWIFSNVPTMNECARYGDEDNTASLMQMSQAN